MKKIISLLAVGLASVAGAVDNLFEGALDEANLRKWYVPKGVSAVREGEGWCFKGDGSQRFASVHYSVNIPPELAGKPVEQEIVLVARTKLIHGTQAVIRQYDEKGALLPETLSDQRWSGHMLPPDKEVRYLESGRIHPRARKLVAIFEMRTSRAEYDNYGRKITDASLRLPAFAVKKLEVRPASLLAFPKWNDDFFAPGVSGREGDYALVSGGADEIGFFHPATTRAGWTQAWQFRNESERALPSGDGTVEAWIKPEWSKLDDKFKLAAVPVFQLYQGIRTRMEKKNFLKEVLGLYYSPSAKKLSFNLVDWKKHTYKAEAKNVEFPAGSWTHVAVSWKCKGMARVFLNGRKVLETAIPEYEAVPLGDKSLNEVNDLWAHQIFVGTTYWEARQRAGFDKDRQTPPLPGAVDELRTSSVMRYAADFTPAKDFALDASTCSLFKFDRSFDGVTGGGFGSIPGSIHARRDRVEHRLAGGWYYPENLLPEHDPGKVFNLVNYPVMPTVNDFTSARRRVTRQFEAKAGDRFKVKTAAGSCMDYVEFENLSATEPLLYPIAVRKGAFDPRSFGDIRESLGVLTLSDRERANRIFQYAISASDYFMNHQVDFPPNSNSTRSAVYQSMMVLNSYCGFECGPLNNMVKTLFVCAGDLPATQTGGYGHSFQQVFFDGKNHVYDLSAQTFFPSFDNESSVYLEEDANQPGVHNRVNRSCGSFVRQGSRSFSVGSPEYHEKVAMILNPGERFRVWRANNGQYNNLKLWHATGTYYPMHKFPVNRDQYNYAEVAGLPADFKWLIRFDRVFPEYSTGFLTFDGKPSAANPAFTGVSASNFCYRAKSCYPIVFGEYFAELGSGGYAKLELSVDGGKTFKPIPMQEGKTVLQYRVKARHEYLIRVNAPIAAVKRWSAKTECEVNPRTYPGWLTDGDNEVAFKAESAAPARVTFAWRERAKSIQVQGGLYYGTIPGQEKQLILATRGTKNEYPVTGVSPKATVKAYGPITAKIAGGVLSVAASENVGDLIPKGYDLPTPWSRDNAFGAVEIEDEGAVKSVLVMLSAGNVHLLTTADAKVSGAKAAVAAADKTSMQSRISLRAKGDRADFACSLPAGEYLVLPLVRYGSHEKNAPKLMMDDPAKPGRTWRVASYINGSLEYLKADYAAKGERAHWKWDSAMRTDWMSEHNGFSYRQYKFPAVKKLSFFIKEDAPSEVELAGVLVVPSPDLELRLDLRRLLSGLNCDPAAVQP